MPESGRADMNFLRIFGVVARERFRALRSQADTLFYVAEPCITGMTPSVRHPLLRASGRTNRGLAISKGTGCRVPDKETAWTLSQKHDGPPKRAVLSSIRVTRLA